MKQLIKKILKEESLKQTLQNVIDTEGVKTAIDLVGDVDVLVKVLYGGDLKEYYRKTGMEPYRLSSEPNLYIDDALVQVLELPDTHNGREKKLGDFRWTSSGMNYRFTAMLYPITYSDGRKAWRVVGSSGDSGFGYSWIAKRNTLGKRARMQIFKQIIDKYNLDSYK